MILAIIGGLIAGVVGFVPLLIGLRATKKVTATSNFGHMAILLLSLVASFVIMFVFAILVAVFARDIALFFVLAEAVGLSVSAIVFGVKKLMDTKEER